MRASIQTPKVFGMTTEKYPEIPLAFRWHAIKVALKKQGYSLTSLSKQSGVTGIASAGKKHYPAAQAEIGKALGVSEKILFPERYDVSWSQEMQAQVEELMPGLFALPETEEPKPLFITMVEEKSLMAVDISSIPAEEPSRLAWVKSELRNRGFVLGTLASHIGVPRSALDNLGSARSPSLQALVATCLGIAPQTIWPERYDEKGVAIPSRRKVGRRWTDRKMEYQLDLSEGLWLPMRDLTGLPGMGNDVTFIIMHGENLGWKIRERFGVYEVAFDSLPTETRSFLLLPTANRNVSAAPDTFHGAQIVSHSVSKTRGIVAVANVDGEISLKVSDGKSLVEVVLGRRDVGALAPALLDAAKAAADSGG